MLQNNQSGRSMMEMLGVLAIIGVLSVGGFGMVQKMRTTYNANKVIDEISELSRKVRIVARDFSGSASDSMNSYVRDAKAYPEGLEGTGTAVFSGADGVNYSITYQGSDYVLFTITATNVPEDVCMQIVTSDWGSNATSGFRGLTVGGASSAVNTSLANGTSVSSKPMSIGSAASSCSDGATIHMSFR